MTVESERLKKDGVAWRRWGPYLSDRAWGTVREDYSPNGDAWSFLPHDHARSKAYRWGEDGIAGFCDRYQRMLYKYPQAEFPYRRLVEENRARQGRGREVELIDTGVLDEGRYFDVEI